MSKELDLLAVATTLVKEGLELKMLFDQTSVQGGQLRLLAHDIYRALEKLRNLIRDHQDYVDCSHLDSLSQLQSDLLLVNTKCAKRWPFNFFATSEQYKDLKRLLAKVEEVTLILNDDSMSSLTSRSAEPQEMHGEDYLPVQSISSQMEDLALQSESDSGGAPDDLAVLPSEQVKTGSDQAFQPLNNENLKVQTPYDPTEASFRHEALSSHSNSITLSATASIQLLSSESGSEAQKQQPSNSHGAEIVQHTLGAVTIQNDNEDEMSSHGSEEISGSESGAASGFSSLSLRSEETENRYARGLHLRKVAASITNVAYQSSTLSQNEEALSLYREAVDIRRQLALEGDEISLCELTESLHQLAHHLRLMNRDEEGIVFDTEVVDIRRELVSRNPGHYMLSLAKGVHMLGHIHNCVQRPQEGLPFIEEEVEIYRKLFAEQPSYQADLGQALHGLAHQLRLVGRQKDGMTPDLESLKLLRELSNS